MRKTGCQAIPVPSWFLPVGNMILLFGCRPWGAIDSFVLVKNLITIESEGRPNHMFCAERGGRQSEMGMKSTNERVLTKER